MATTERGERARTFNLPAPRVVKCPTPQCPGWITVDSTRHQTEPCRYCRVGVDTLRFLLSRVGAENKVLPVEVHEEFNRLMLTMAGAWGQNVYLRPSRETLVDLKAGQRGVIVEYNPALGRRARMVPRLWWGSFCTSCSTLRRTWGTSRCKLW